MGLKSADIGVIGTYAAYFDRRGDWTNHGGCSNDVNIDVLVFTGSLLAGYSCMRRMNRDEIVGGLKSPRPLGEVST